MIITPFQRWDLSKDNCNIWNTLFYLFIYSLSLLPRIQICEGRDPVCLVSICTQCPAHYRHLADFCCMTVEYLYEKIRGCGRDFCSRYHIKSMPLLSVSSFPWDLLICFLKVLPFSFLSRRMARRCSWVAQWLSICFQLRAWSQGPGIEFCIRLPAESLLLPPPMSLPLSLCLSWINK